MNHLRLTLSFIVLACGSAGAASAGTAGVPNQAPGLLIAPDAGGLPEVRIQPVDPSQRIQAFLPYGGGFPGGVRVASGDVTGDGVDDIITGAGPGAGPHVKVFDGRTGSELRSFFAFPASFSGGVTVAAGDVNGDGSDDIAVVAGSGGNGHVKVFDGKTGGELASFFAFGGFTGGVSVDMGDVNNDGIADIVVGAGPGAPGGHVKVFSGVDFSELSSFFAFDTSFTGGVNVAVGHVDADPNEDIIVGAATLSSHVKVFSGASGAELQSFFAFAGFSGGVRVAAGDINGDHFYDMIVGVGPGPVEAGSPHVKVFNGRGGSELASFFAFGAAINPGVEVGFINLSNTGPCPGDADGNGEVNFTDIAATLSNFGTMCP